MSPSILISLSTPKFYSITISDILFKKASENPQLLMQLIFFIFLK